MKSHDPSAFCRVKFAQAGIERDRSGVVENTVPFDIWKFRKVKPEILVEWNAPLLFERWLKGQWSSLSPALNRDRRLGFLGFFWYQTWWRNLLKMFAQEYDVWFSDQHKWDARVTFDIFAFGRTDLRHSELFLKAIRLAGRRNQHRRWN